MKKININKVMFVAVILVVTSISSAVEETWTRKADMPTARFGLTTSVVDGKIYAIGGGQSPYGSYLSTVEEYDPATDTWTRKADMPTARSGHAASVVNGKIYVVGGDVSPEVSCNTVEEYDPATNTWMSKADMPTKRTFLCACTVDGKIYVFGGVTAGVPGATWNPPTLDVYDPATNTWETRGSIPTPRGLASASVVDGKIYVIGGAAGSLEGAALPTVDEYDPVVDTWTRKANMPTARTWSSSGVVNGKIYVIGGANYGGPVFSTVEEYDPTTNTWTMKLDMPTHRGMFSTSVVNGNIYAIGGTQIWWPWTGTSTVEEYDTGLTPSQPDFNGDGLVDIKDLLRLIESWDQDDPTIDIAPPFGDGIVDVLDLELLMSYWEHPVDDPTLLAHWALDEAEGDIAHDNAGVNDASVIGEPAWQPDVGMVGGALALDGVDDCVITNAIINPADGSFSIFAWIKGGVPEQVVVSQHGAANWLVADAEGNLMTGLKGTGRSVGPLFSETVITDGQWHRVGFVWDELYRSLYVDDILVAEDAQSELSYSFDGLNIGCGSNSETGTFWSGLIDEIRVYNRVVSP